MLALRRELGNRRGEANARHQLAVIDQLQDDYERARSSAPCSPCAASSATAAAKPTPDTASPSLVRKGGDRGRARLGRVYVIAICRALLPSQLCALISWIDPRSPADDVHSCCSRGPWPVACLSFSYEELVNPSHAVCFAES